MRPGSRKARHAIGAENEIPDISEYSGGEAGTSRSGIRQAKEITARGRTFCSAGSRTSRRDHLQA